LEFDLQPRPIYFIRVSVVEKSQEFDEVAAELARTLNVFKVPPREMGELLAAFAAHKDEVTAGYKAKG